MTTILFIRHGETDWNIEGRWQGQIDIPLNSNGHRQARETSQRLTDSPIVAIYSSDLSRAAETASHLALRLNLEVQVDKRLREIHQGEWQGLKVTEIQHKYEERFQSRSKNPMLVAPPGGETAAQVGLRIYSFLVDVVRAYPTETVAIVTHGFVIALVKVLLDDEPIEKLWDNIPVSGGQISFKVTEQSIHQAFSRLEIE